LSDPTEDAVSSLCHEVAATAVAAPTHPKRIRRIDALANIIKSARLISKSPPGRSYGGVRWDL
jgi:hypothetical protein